MQRGNYTASDIVYIFHNFPHLSPELKPVDNSWDLSTDSNLYSPYLQSLFVFPIIILLLQTLILLLILFNVHFGLKLQLPAPNNLIQERRFVAGLLTCTFAALMLCTGLTVFAEQVSRGGMRAVTRMRTLRNFLGQLDNEEVYLHNSAVVVESITASISSCNPAAELLQPSLEVRNASVVHTECVDGAFGRVGGIMKTFRFIGSSIVSRDVWLFACVAFMVTLAFFIAYALGKRLWTRIAVIVAVWLNLSLTVLQACLLVVVVGLSDACIDPWDSTLNFYKDANPYLFASIRYWIECEGESPFYSTLGEDFTTH